MTKEWEEFLSTNHIKFQYPEGFWPDSDHLCPRSRLYERVEVRFSTPKGFGPIVTIVTQATIPDDGTLFQYPEGFWPDSDLGPR